MNATYRTSSMPALAGAVYLVLTVNFYILLHTVPSSCAFSGGGPVSQNPSMTIQKSIEVGKEDYIITIHPN